MLGEYRPEEISLTDSHRVHILNSMLADLRSWHTASIIELASFDEDNTQAFLEQYCAANDLPMHVAKQLVRDIEGIPWYMELALASQNSEQLPTHEDDHRLKQHGTSVSAKHSHDSLDGFPPQVAENIERLLDKLEESPTQPSKLRRVLQYASVQGASFNAQLLTRYLPPPSSIENVEEQLELIASLNLGRNSPTKGARPSPS